MEELEKLKEKAIKLVKKRLNILERNIINELKLIRLNMFSIKKWVIGSIILFMILFLSVISAK